MGRRLGFALDPVPARWQPIDVDDPDDDPEPFDGWSVLLEAIDQRRPAWQADAACRDHPEVTWFPERGESVEPAKALCATCTCADACRSYALELGTTHGIWSGESARNLRRAATA